MSEKKFPVVSVITVVYNAESYLEDTISSVVTQTYPNKEFIVVDGGSTDGTLEIIQKYERRIGKWISERDNGIYDAMNKGLTLASGEWVTFLNGGDTYYSNETLSELFGQQDVSSFDFIYGDAINVGENFRKYIPARVLTRKSLRSGMGVCHQSMFVRRSIAPMYDLKFKFKAEYNWVIDILEKVGEKRTRYFKLPVVYYALGGFSEKGLIKNLREFIQISWRRFGPVSTIGNIPLFAVILLRYFKYKYFGYGQ